MNKFELSASETLLVLKALAWYSKDDETCSMDKELSKMLIKNLNEQVKITHNHRGTTFLM